ncbi:MAG TPA: carboxyl transferase domain-containing protein, partial [Actinomycetota bacterium]|nr:carboxyl transferase domain-containing protein [Actinomycetota bacterium]
TGERLPDDSHTAESALQHGLVDEIVAPSEIRNHVSRFLGPPQGGWSVLAGQQLRGDDAPTGGDSWNEVLLARDEKRPTGADYMPGGTILGRGGTDASVLVSVADDWFKHNRPVFIAQNRFAGTGRTRPGGYARARRAIDFAVRFSRPIVTLIDTPGADPSADSEAEGIAREISKTFNALLNAPVPTVAICVGEGGSGGALAFAACDVLLILEHSIFSVIAPEGAGAILRRSDLESVAGELRLTAHDLKEFGLADRVIAEPPGGTQADPHRAIEMINVAISLALDGMTSPTERRLERWRVYR